MTDEPVHMQPAIPSRAAQTPATPFTQPAFLENPSPGTSPAKKKPRPRQQGAVTAYARPKKKAKALPAAEIRKINAKRKKNLPRTRAQKKAAAKRIVGKHPALAAPYKGTRAVKGDPYVAMAGRAKNPNRPLEMKNQLSAVLSMVGTLQKQELVFFSQAVPAMQALSRAGRKRVIAALQQVYG